MPGRLMSMMMTAGSALARKLDAHLGGRGRDQLDALEDAEQVAHERDVGGIVFDVEDD